MFKSIVAVAFAAAALAAAPTASVEAQDFHPFDMCVMNGTEACYPRDEFGPYLPTWGSPEEAAMFQCLADLEAVCESIHGRP